MNATYDESIHALSGAYAVDALDTFERKAFEAHLSRCAECRTEVRSLREATALLGLPDAVPPPASLRDKVLRGAAGVRPLPPLTGRDDHRYLHHDETAHGGTASEPEEGSHGNVVPLRQRFPHVGRRARLGLAAAAAAVIAVGAGVVVQPWESSTPTSTVVAASEILQAPDAETVSQKFPDGSRATVTRSLDQGRAVLQTSNMAEPPSDRAFEVWLMDEFGNAEPAALMTEAGDRTVVLEGDASDAAAVGITVEPLEGSAAPTTEPIAMFELSQENG